MSNPARKPQSAINSFTRDWSDSGAQASQSSPEIYWSPSPPPQPRQQVKLSAREQRMKDIEDALSGNPVSSERNPPNSQPLISSKAINKRPSPGSESALPAKKARELPKSWKEPDILTSSTAYSSSSSNRVNHKISNTNTITAPPSSSKKGKVAGVFLSAEQNQILKLVQDEHSVFYTGSAGEYSTRIYAIIHPLTPIKEPVNLSYCVKSSKLFARNMSNPPMPLPSPLLLVLLRAILEASLFTRFLELALVSRALRICVKRLERTRRPWRDG